MYADDTNLSVTGETASDIEMKFIIMYLKMFTTGY